MSKALVVAMVALAAPAWAQRALVLEFDGDDFNRLYTQVVQTVVAGGRVALVSDAEYRAAAERIGLGSAKPDRKALRALMVPLRINAVVDAQVRRGKAHLVILGPTADEVWSKELPLQKGVLTSEHAWRLASAIAAATGPSRVDRPLPGRAPAPLVDRAPPPPFEEPRPELVRATFSGHTIWRTYCARPEVRTCREWSLMPVRPSGETQDFTSRYPYSGVFFDGELFPFRGVPTRWLSGLGVGGSYGAAFSQSMVHVTTPSATTSEVPVRGTDNAFTAHALYRAYFWITDAHFMAYGGLRAGIAGRTFEVDPASPVPLASSHRIAPQAGLDVGLRLSPLLSLEASVVYLHDPHASALDVRPYGQTSTARGIGAELGARGELWGPFGYSVRGQLYGYGDVITGSGLRWPLGGAAEELYLSVSWGVFVHY